MNGFNDLFTELNQRREQLARHLDQLNSAGSGNPVLDAKIAIDRGVISNLKALLRNSGEAIDDHADDEGRQIQVLPIAQARLGSELLSQVGLPQRGFAPALLRVVADILDAQDSKNQRNNEQNHGEIKGIVTAHEAQQMPGVGSEFATILRSANLGARYGLFFSDHSQVGDIAIEQVIVGDSVLNHYEIKYEIKIYFTSPSKPSPSEQFTSQAPASDPLIDLPAHLRHARRKIAEGLYQEATELLDELLKSHPQTQEAVRELVTLSERFEVPFITRRYAAETVARVGDSRFPVQFEEWQQSIVSRPKTFSAAVWNNQTPPPYWRLVNSGTYRVGGWSLGAPAANVHIGPFWIARFPVTIAQYAEHVAAGSTAPNQWKSIPAQSENAPVVGVTWYQAIRYAAWLTRKLHAALPENYVIRLPSEAEWEIAAAYDLYQERKPFPWGHEPLNLEYAAYKAGAFKHPAPVGCHPRGSAHCGAADLLGNIWELTGSNWWDYPKYAHRSLDVRTVVPVAWRGGSYCSSADEIDCSIRGWIFPDQHTAPDGGFRLVLGSKLRLRRIFEL
ncbi:MAG: formylglycine-generating enzyme family protein [Blastochloris sp.]|nr:formylglycine-generating enzyme family protein [Blastochloris sp.]